MLKVRLYLDPSDGSKTRYIGHVNIVNTGMGTLVRGEYYAHFYHEGKLVKSTQVSNWPRQERNAWELLVAAWVAPNLAEAPDA